MRDITLRVVIYESVAKMFAGPDKLIVLQELANNCSNFEDTEAGGGLYGMILSVDLLFSPSLAQALFTLAHARSFELAREGYVSRLAFPE